MICIHKSVVRSDSGGIVHVFSRSCHRNLYIRGGEIERPRAEQSQGNCSNTGKALYYVTSPDVLPMTSEVQRLDLVSRV